MICDCCGAEYADNLLSCPYCGTATAVSDDTPDAHCPRCAAPIMQGQPMCQQCGLALDLHHQRVQVQNMYNNQPQSMPNVEYDQNGQPKLHNQQNPQGKYNQYNQPNQYNQTYYTNQTPYMQKNSEKPKYNPDDPAQARNARICLIVAAAALAIAFISPVVAIMLATMALKYANGTACATARTVGIIAIIAAIVCAGFSTMSINISLD